MKRIYEDLLVDHFTHNRQMAFLSGPRQAGKTTLAKSVLPESRYFNYDMTSDAIVIAAGADRVARVSDFSNPLVKRSGVIFDELHKFPKWKHFLKGFFDVYGEQLPVAVTGSARLNVYKRGGDSLMGRYFPYHVHPLSIGELADAAADIEEEFRSPREVSREMLASLLEYGGYPEPFLKASSRFYVRWREGRLEKIFSEDLRDLSRVMDIRGVRSLGELLCARVTGGVNFSSLAQDLSVSPDTAKAWHALLESVFYVFTIRPYFKNVANSIRKQPKTYFWDWSQVAEGGARNENLIASHLLKNVQWWTDAGQGKYELCYVRDKQGREVDFLVVKDGMPYILVECKSSMREEMSASLEYYRKSLHVPFAFQVGMDGEYSGLDPLSSKTQCIKISALDLLKILR